MNRDDYDAVTYANGLYCVGCAPVPLDHVNVAPVFADSEWDSYPSCDRCGKVHDYVRLRPHGEAHR
jgi:hypothetical protein